MGREGRTETGERLSHAHRGGAAARKREREESPLSKDPTDCTYSMHGLWNDGWSSVNMAGLTIFECILMGVRGYHGSFEASTDSMLCPCARLEWISHAVRDVHYIIV